MIVAATGHRPDKLGGYGADVAGRLFALAREELVRLQASRVISGMAVGWDTAIARAALELQIPLVCAVPFRGQEACWPVESQRVYREILGRADRVVYVSPDGYAAWKMMLRNRWMVDRCDVVLALHDGSTGGTFNCIEYATKVARKPIENAWERWVS